MLLCTLAAAAFEAPESGTWSGTLSCSENRLNGRPGYSQQVAVVLQAGAGRSELDDGQTLAHLTVSADAHGRVLVESDGRWRHGEPRAWQIRLEGSHFSGRIEALGSMRATEGGALLRERCALVMQPQTAASAPALSTPPLQGTAPVPTPPPVSVPGRSSPDHQRNLIRRVAKGNQHDQTEFTATGLPMLNGVSILPPSWLYGTGQPWHYRASGRAAAPVPTRSATPVEMRVLDATRELVQNLGIEVIALIDGGRIVDVVAGPRPQFDSLMMSASMAKTVMAVAAGTAMCEGRIRLDTTAAELVPELAGKDLGRATLRDALMMASGTTAPPDRDVMGVTAQEFREHLEGTGSLPRLLALPSQSTAQRGLLSVVKPGERFSYKARDPFLASLMIERAVGMRATSWLDTQLFAAIPLEHPAVLATDRQGYFHGANGSVRLALIDWIRLAIHVQAERARPSCMGAFLRDMGTTQIRAPRQDGVNGYFDGYGYFVWTENPTVPNTFWAVGYGGQRIGWSVDPKNQRIFLMFSISADRDMAKVYPVADAWIRLGNNGR